MYAYFDASALAKRYVRETGSPEVNYVFARAAGRIMVLTVGIGEVASVLARKRNRGELSAENYTLATAEFQAEMFRSPAVRKVDVDPLIVERSLPLIAAHALNATDALILRTALDFVAVGGRVVLASSDRRLVTAAAAEGLPCYDPEREPVAEFEAVWVTVGRNGTG